MRLVLPADFGEYAWEVEAKGVFWDAKIDVDGVHVSLTFYDEVRLAQDVAEELAQARVFGCNRLLVVERLTAENMQAAVDAMPSSFFE